MSSMNLPRVRSGGTECASEHERDQRPGNRDAKLGAGTGEHALELRDAAEEPERDPFDRDPLSACPQRMPELVQQQRAEEERGRDERHREMRTGAEARVRRREDPVASVQTSSAKTTSQLQLRPISRPA